MTCKDCIHQELCKDYVSSLAKAQNADPKFIAKWLDEIEGKGEHADSDCEHFADRSRFVELPCRVSGDCFFVNQNGTIQRATLERVYMFSTSTELFLNDGREIYSTSLNESNIELFPTYEEAEQALKERERNA